MALLDVKIDEKAGTLIIILSLEKKPKASKSGKSLVVADSGGRESTGILMDKQGRRAGKDSGGKDIQISAVAYIEK